MINMYVIYHILQKNNLQKNNLQKNNLQKRIEK